MPTLELARLVEARIGQPVLEAPSRAQVSIEGHVRPLSGDEGEGWLAVVEVRDAGGKMLGRRELRSRKASCRSLDLPVSLVVALAIDSDTALPMLIDRGGLSQEARTLLGQLDLPADDPDAALELLTPVQATRAASTAKPRSSATGSAPPGATADGGQPAARPKVPMVSVSQAELDRLRTIEAAARESGDADVATTPDWPGYVMLGGGAVLAGLTVYSVLKLQSIEQNSTFTTYRAQAGAMPEPGTVNDACASAEKGVLFGLPTDHLKRVRDLCAQGDLFGTLTWIFLGGAVASIGAGSAWLLWIGDEGDADDVGEPTVQVFPSLGAGHGSLSVRLRL